MIYLYLKHLLNLKSSWVCLTLNCHLIKNRAPRGRILLLERLLSYRVGLSTWSDLKAPHSTSSFRMSELETNVVVTKVTPWLYWGENQEAKKWRTCPRSHCKSVVGLELEARFSDSLSNGSSSPHLSMMFLARHPVAPDLTFLSLYYDNSED